jgi:phage tail sheath protein FI
MRPGVNISISTTPPVKGVSTDSGVWFVTGITEKGPVDKARKITSLAEYVRYYGDRYTSGQLYDALDVFFREGGNTAYVSRLVGPAAVTATVNVNDSGASATMRVDASSPGAWGNSINVQVLDGGSGTWYLQVTHDTIAGVLEVSPKFTSIAAAVDWAANSDWIRLADIGPSSNQPNPGAVLSLATGADDIAGIVEATWTAALTDFTRDLGPGQVSAPGRTTGQAHLDLQAHAAANNRTAILDPPDTITEATLLSMVDAANGTNGRWSGVWGPWLRVPGVVPNTSRTVPPSALIAGKIAASDALSGSPNKPAAGSQRGVAKYVTGLTQPAFADSVRENLNTQGFNAIITKYGLIEIYGWRSLADYQNEAAWNNFGNSRLVMQIAGLADQIGETFIFEEIDGQGRTINAFGAALVGMLMPYYDLGSLYGTSPDQAFVVDVGPSVNTPTTIANKELRAKIAIRPSQFAEMITIEIVKALVTESI